MKKILLLPLVVMVFLLLGACDFEFSSIDTLMRPPLTSTERKLDESIRSLLGNDISLRSPEYGNNHSAITLHDLDGDKTDEAIVFYANKNASSVIRMSVLKRTEKGWAIVSDFAGNGSGVFSLDFYDLNNDSCDDMLVSWYLFEDKVNKTLTVYSCSRSATEVKFSACATEPYNLMCIDDVLGTGEKQIVLAYTDTSKDEVRTDVRLMRLSTDNRVIQLCKKNLDSRITKIHSVQTDKPGASGTRIFVDAEIADKKNITEVLVWSEKNSNLVFVISGRTDGLNDATVRSNTFFVQDIDNDGLLEIPLKDTLAQSADSDLSVGYLLVWNEIVNGTLKAKEHYVVNLQGNYRLRFSEQLMKKVLVCSDNLTGHWKFLDAENQAELFNIVIYGIDDWSDYSDKVTAMLHTNNNKVYACNITEAGEAFGIDINELKENFSMNT